MSDDKARIEALSADIAQLRAALEPFADMADRIDQAWTSGHSYRDDDKVNPLIRVGAFRAARAAWNGAKP